MIRLSGNTLTFEEVERVARFGEKVAALSPEDQQRMLSSHKWVVDSVEEGEMVIYGVTTGFGSLASQTIPAKDTRKLSRNLILACLTGVGLPLRTDVVRAMMLIRANLLMKGYSGVRPIISQTLIDMLNQEITPRVPCKGSLGASGDLAPLAHIAVVMTRDPEDGEGGYSGNAWIGNEYLSGAEAMAKAGIQRVILEAREGLALTNGTDYMVAAGILALQDAKNLILTAEIASAMSLEALLGLSAAFHPAIHKATSQPGQINTARNIRTLIAGSQLIDSAQAKVQDAYSLRCIPQVIGPIRDTVVFLSERFTTALNAFTDNPLIFSDPENSCTYRAISGGNFHGQGPAMWHDFLGIAMAEIGSLSERRIFRLLTPELSCGLSSMLIPASGVDSGLMMVQYTAAALVSENKTLAHPDSVDSIPSCANQEDHVSMGPNAARHTGEILENIAKIIAIELLTAAQAIDLRPEGQTKLGIGVQAAYQTIRRYAPFVVHDRELSSIIEGLTEQVQNGTIVKDVSRVCELIQS
jgi:histidine ammonia-lyase